MFEGNSVDYDKRRCYTSDFFHSFTVPRCPILKIQPSTSCSAKKEPLLPLYCPVKINKEDSKYFKEILETS